MPIGKKTPTTPAVTPAKGGIGSRRFRKESQAPKSEKPAEQTTAAQAAEEHPTGRITFGLNPKTGKPRAFVQIGGKKDQIAVPVTVFNPNIDTNHPTYYDVRFMPTSREGVYKAIPLDPGKLGHGELVATITVKGKNLKVVEDKTEGRGRNKRRFVRMRLIEHDLEGKERDGAFVFPREGVQPPTAEQAEEDFTLATTYGLAYILVGPAQQAVGEASQLAATESVNPLEVRNVAYIPISPDGSVGKMVLVPPEMVLGFRPMPSVELLEAFRLNENSPILTRSFKISAGDQATLIESRNQMVARGELTHAIIDERLAQARHALAYLHPDRLDLRTDIPSWKRSRVKHVYGLSMSGLDNAAADLHAWLSVTEAIAAASAEATRRQLAAEASAAAARQAKREQRPSFSLTVAVTEWRKLLGQANETLPPASRFGDKSLDSYARDIGLRLELMPNQLHPDIAQGILQLHNVGCPADLQMTVWRLALNQTSDQSNLGDQAAEMDQRLAELTAEWAAWIKRQTFGKKVAVRKRLAEAIAPAANCLPEVLLKVDDSILEDALQNIEEGDLKRQIRAALRTPADKQVQRRKKSARRQAAEAEQDDELDITD